MSGMGVPSHEPPLSGFHPAVQHWFSTTHASPTPCQNEAWEAIKAGGDALIAAPTGSGKTLAAFLSAIDRLIFENESAPLAETTRILYLSPLKALSNDIKKNLEVPLREIRAQGLAPSLEPRPLKVAVRTGDTPARERQAMLRHPPHILASTPESLYLLLTSVGGRKLLSTIDTVIVDEIHTLIESKRGAHLALSLERLDLLTPRKAQRIGLSATQRPIEQGAHFLTGGRPCAIIDRGHLRAMSLSIELPERPLESVLSQEQATDLFNRMAVRISEARTTLVFVNTRRQAERIARALTERLGKDQVTSHHGSLSRGQRLEAEERLKAGRLKALIATASLELGIDVGTIDQVFQWSSPHSITGLLQRVGRSGHFFEGHPKGILFPTSRDDLIECIALIDAVRRGDLEILRLPDSPLDVLAQQIIAMVACEDWMEDELYDRVCRAWPYRALCRSQFDQVIDMLAAGFATVRGPRGAYLHRDRLLHRLKPRAGARLTSLTCGGTIPDTAEYRVVLEPQGDVIGTVDEDFAIESTCGDIFQLGNTSWRILGLERDRLRVENANNQPPTLPFWFGEAPGRSRALSSSLSRIRRQLEDIFQPSPNQEGVRQAIHWLESTLEVPSMAAQQAVHYLFLAYRALNCLPSETTVVIERFFDETGGMQLVIHAPLGSRTNRAWGLALRKRFCRTFNFELQAAATEEAILLSLGTSQSFSLAEIAHYLSPETVREVLIQAVLDAPMFTVRWRWNVLNALAVKRFQFGQKTPPHLIRMQSEDLVTAVFPDQLACLENIRGDRRIPDHPLVFQSLKDCLTEAMDVDHLTEVLEGIRAGRIRIETRQLREASPLSLEILNARVYSFLDDAPLPERRTRAVRARRWLDLDEATDLSRIDSSALHEALRQAWPRMRSAEEVHEALVNTGYLREAELSPEQNRLLENLIIEHRAGWLGEAPERLWFATERGAEIQQLGPQRSPAKATLRPETLDNWIPKPPEPNAPTAELALVSLLRARLGAVGPQSLETLASELDLPPVLIHSALLALEGEGTLIRNPFENPLRLEWCDRTLLSRIHRAHLSRQRRSVQAVPKPVYMRFLFRWQHLHPSTQLLGPEGLAQVLEQLQGHEAPAPIWDQGLIPDRMMDYDPHWLNQLCLSGRFIWGRFSGERTSAAPIRATPIALIERRQWPLWQPIFPKPLAEGLSAPGRMLLQCLQSQGALFFEDLLQRTQLLPNQVEQGLSELVARGIVHSDGFDGLRALLRSKRQRIRPRQSPRNFDSAGRWTLLIRPGDPPAEVPEQVQQQLIQRLCGRYGVLFKALFKSMAPGYRWGDCLRLLKRMEARGELRSGRFIEGQLGEQFALEEAVIALERMAREPDAETHLLVLSACDPACLLPLHPELNLSNLQTHRVLYRDGQPLALKRGGEIIYLEDPGEAAWSYRHLLLRGNATQGARPDALRRSPSRAQRPTPGSSVIS